MTQRSILFLLIMFVFIPISICAQTAELKPGAAIEKKILDGQSHPFFITLKKGEYATCIVMQKGVDLVVDLSSPALKKIQSFDSPNGTDGPEPIFIVANESGKYQLQIHTFANPNQNDPVNPAFTSGNQGDYTISDIKIIAAKDYKKILAKAASDKATFKNWITANAHELKTVDAGNGFDDLTPYQEILKNVTVVGLGESSHGTSEFFRMKHRMLEYLVKEQGFNSFYIEASMSRCRYINDYVLHGKGSLDTATVIQGFTTWRVEEVRNMIEWMRQYNKNIADDKKVKFMGFDLQINDLGWKDLSKFYSIANPQMVVRLDTIEKKTARAGYLSNGPAAQQQQGATLFKAVYIQALDVLNNMVLNQGQYQYMTSKEMYDANLVNLKLIIQEIESYKDNYNDRRDYYMAENIMSLLNAEKAGAKVVVWAHNGHIQKKYNPDTGAGYMGYFLSRYLKDKYYAIGFEFYSGTFLSRNIDLNPPTMGHWDIIPSGIPPEESLPWYLSETGKDKFFLDFRNSDIKKNARFAQPFQAHFFGSSFSPKYGNLMSKMDLPDYDGMIYIKESNAAKSFAPKVR